MPRATLSFTSRRTRFRVCVVVLVLLPSAANWGAVLALVFLFFGALGHVVSCRSFRRTVPPGTVQRTGFGRDEFLTAKGSVLVPLLVPSSAVVGSHGGFVPIRFAGHHVMRVHRRAVPPDAMTCLREGSAPGRSPSPR